MYDSHNIDLTSCLQIPRRIVGIWIDDFHENPDATGDVEFEKGYSGGSPKETSRVSVSPGRNGEQHDQRPSRVHRPREELPPVDETRF